ncbi:hypothetical protein ACFQAT_24695 [Undibacterium arcticum]|uniref:hypothetical protein n=1 Tax=Undibacterium arcticum TaxID=1762892 RepID=UPI003615DF9A
MKPIRRAAPSVIGIDFAPASIRRSIARTGLWAWLIGTAGLLLCVGAAMIASELMQQRSALKSELRQTQTALAARALRQPAATQLATQLATSVAQALAVNGAIAQLNLPWRDVFESIESATPATIALLALEPDAKKQLVKGWAEANQRCDDCLYRAVEKAGFFRRRAPD